MQAIDALYEFRDNLDTVDFDTDVFHRELGPADFREHSSLFNLVWVFIVFQRVPESYQRYFASVGRNDVGDCGKSIGLWYAICVV